MDLWIRSQDKESLLKIENISIDNENWILGNLISDDNNCICDYWKLGHYETKERALEVLDEIEKRLKNNVYFKQSALELKNGFNKLYIPYEESSQVYQMPKE